MKLVPVVFPLPVYSDGGSLIWEWLAVDGCDADTGCSWDILETVFLTYYDGPLQTSHLAGGIVQEDESVDGVDGGYLSCVYVCCMQLITVR